MFPSDFVIRFVFALACVALLSSCKTQQAASSSAPPPVPVSLARATQESVPFELRVVGTVEASTVVQVKSQVAGQLMKVRFTEGQNVAHGDLLFEIDPQPYEQALRQAEGAVARDRAQLSQAEAMLARDRAQLANAEADARRSAELAKEGVISRAQQDQFRTAAEVARESARASQAAIESARGALQSDEAAVQKAKLDLSYCRIYAPASGRTGNLLIHEGNLVRANGDNAMVVIHQIAPVFVNFNVPEQHLSTIRQLDREHRLPIQVFAQNNLTRAALGQVKVIDNTVDTSTGTIRLKAVLPNQDAYLWPGQFVNVVLALGATRNATVVPAEAVQSGQDGPFVYVVKPDQTVEPRTIQTGRAVDSRMIVEKGVAAGDTVVIDGQLRLFPGARIKPVDARKIEGTKL